MLIGFDAKRYYHNYTGLGNYARTIVGGLQTFCPELHLRLYDEKAWDRTFRLARKAERDGCRILHGLSNELPRDCRHRTRLRSFVTMHDVAWRAFPGMYSWVDRQLYDWKYGFSARHADHVIAISESTRRQVQQAFDVEDSRISVVYQPVQPLFYTPVAREQARRMAEAAVPGLPQEFLLSVGSVNSRKNLLGSLRALATLPAGSRPPLVVVGNGHEYMAECRDFAVRSLRRQDVFWVTDLADNNVLQALYTCALALLYPSHYEGFGLPVAEALLQGCPVLTSQGSSLPEAAGPGAILTDPADPEALSDALHRLVDDSLLRRKLATEGERYCRETFDPERLARQLCALYRR